MAVNVGVLAESCWRSRFWISDQLCQYAHSADKEWSDLVDLHSTQIRKLDEIRTVLSERRHVAQEA